VVADPRSRTVRIWQLEAGRYAETGRSALLGVGADELTATLAWP
jgi:hypothetical protein